MLELNRRLVKYQTRCGSFALCPFMVFGRQHHSYLGGAALTDTQKFF